MSSQEPPADDAFDAPSFASLGLRDEVLTALTALGYEEPTPIQAATIKPLIEGRDLIGQAATGTGKTAAFALPVLERLGDRNGTDRPGALVLAPTRELAMQVSEAIHKYGRGLGARVLPVFGGQPIGRQIGALKRGVDVVVATPGRAVDLIERGSLKLEDIEVVVLDEADEMLDMGFADDLEAILDQTPPTRQTVLFSATLPPRIASIAKRHLTDPVRIEVERVAPAAGEAPAVRQTAYLVPRSHKPAALGRILDVENPGATIVFCRTRLEVDELTETLNGRGYRAEALHGGMDQMQRDRVLGRLRSETAELLVATDVAARGLDIDHLTHVVNYDVPSAPESYVHRIGRVGRAGRDGVALTLAEPRQHRLLKNIERVTGQQIAIEQVPSVDDLRSRRMELLQETLETAIADGGHDRYRSVVESLAEDHDLLEVALAAIGLFQEERGAEDDDVEIPEVTLRPERNRRDRDDRFDRGDRRGRGRDAGGGGDRFDRGDRSDRGDRGGRDRPVSPGMTRLFVPAGHEARIRPGDLVGAICNETNLTGRDIGAIEIKGRFSLVEVPSGAADEVIDAFRSTTLKGRKVNVRREIQR